MAKASISLEDAYMKNATTAVIKFVCNCKAGYAIKLNDTYGETAQDSGSVRLYYSTTKTVTKDNNFTTMQMYNTNNPGLGIVRNTFYIPGVGYRCTIEWELPNPNAVYYIQLRMLIYRSNDETVDDPWGPGAEVGHYASHKSPAYPSSIRGLDPEEPEYHDYGRTNQPLFMLCTYNNKHTVVDEDGEHEEWEPTWKDFTQNVELPSYDVNNEDVNEDWEDANYFTHRVRVRGKASGKLNLIFADLKSYNEFMLLLKRNKERNGVGTAYVQLQLQINDDIDDLSNDDVSLMRCSVKQGYFFVKIENNPWVAPVFGHFDKYQSIGLDIQEA